MAPGQCSITSLQPILHIPANHSAMMTNRESCNECKAWAKVFCWQLVRLTALSAAVLSGAVELAAQDERPVDWKTGADFVRAAADRMGVSWQDAPLRRETSVLARSTGLCIVLDRRIDPGRLCTLAVSGTNCEAFLWRVADQSGDGVVRLDPVLYLGPLPAVAELPMRTDEIRSALEDRRVAGAVRSRWISGVRWNRPAPFEPREHVEQAVAAAGLTISGLEQIPHDFWPPLDWPEMPFYQALTLMLTGFELEVEIGADGSARIRKIAERKECLFRPGGALKPGLLSRVRALEGVSVGGSARQPVLRGSAACIGQAMRMMALESGDPVQGGAGGETVFTLHTRASRGNIAATGARILNCRLVCDDPAARVILEQVIDVNLDRAAAGDVLDAALEQSGLVWEQVDSEIRIGFRRQEDPPADAGH